MFHRIFDIHKTSTRAIAPLLLAVMLGGVPPAAQAKGKSAAQAGYSVAQQAIYETPGSQASLSSLMNLRGSKGYAITASGTLQGIYCQTVYPGGLASRLRMSNGDLLISLNGSGLSDISQADRSLQASKANSVNVSFAHRGPDGVRTYQTSTPFGFQAESQVNTVQGSVYSKNTLQMYGPRTK